MQTYVIVVPEHKLQKATQETCLTILPLSEVLKSLKALDPDALSASQDLLPAVTMLYHLTAALLTPHNLDEIQGWAQVISTAQQSRNQTL